MSTPLQSATDCQAKLLETASDRPSENDPGSWSQFPRFPQSQDCTIMINVVTKIHINVKVLLQIKLLLEPFAKLEIMGRSFVHC